MPFLISSFLSILLINSCISTFPTGIERCPPADLPCIAKVTTDILNKYPNGKSDLGLPKIEPFNVKKIVITESKSSPVKLDLLFHDVDISGLSKAIVEKAVGFLEEPEKSDFELYGKVPYLTIRGKYKAGGQILVLPIQGDGNADFRFEELKVSVKFKPIITRKDGKIYFAVDKIKVLLEPSNLKIQLDNLFNGDKALSDNMNTFLNENWRDVWNELSDPINEAVAEVIKNIITDIFKKITYDEIYRKD